MAYFLTNTKRVIVMGIISKNVARQPKLSITLAPITRSITAPADNIELNIPCATASIIHGEEGKMSILICLFTILFADFFSIL